MGYSPSLNGCFYCPDLKVTSTPVFDVGSVFAQYYGEAEWISASGDLSKPRKGWRHVTTVFVFKHGVVFLCQERLKGKPGKLRVTKSFPQFDYIVCISRMMC